MKHLLPLIALCASLFCTAQNLETVYSANIGMPQLYLSGDQLAYPILRLNTPDQMELSFDDLDGDVKNYYYTFQLCNADWSTAQVSEFDYLKGFSQVRIGDYRYSSIALTRYTHYRALLPGPDCTPIHSGNYILKVFLDGDTTKLAFTRRFLVSDLKATIEAQLLQPISYEQSLTHQRILFKVNTRAVNPPDPLSQIKVVVLQNARWDNAITGIKPSFFANNNLEYNGENDCVFPGGMEWRWLDLQSFRYQSDRVQRAIYGKTSTEIFARPDGDRSHQLYYFYRDYNGHFFLQTTESLNPFYETDYARVHFAYVPPGNSPFPDKDLYLFGQLTDYGGRDSALMRFNTETGRYETSLFLKQGFYSYSYVTVDRRDPNRQASFDLTEGNHLETENDYLILVYYLPLGGRADQLIGLLKLNSLSGH